MAKDAVGRELKVGDIVILHGRVASVSGNSVTVACTNASTADADAHAKAVEAWKAKRDAIRDPDEMRTFLATTACPRLEPLKSTVSISDSRHLEAHV